MITGYKGPPFTPGMRPVTPSFMMGGASGGYNAYAGNTTASTGADFGGGDASLGDGGGAGGYDVSNGDSGDPSTGGDYGGVGYQRGGLVRRRRRRRRMLRRPPERLSKDPGPPMIRRRRRLMRRPTGYAGGGAVNPALMSVSLDSRSRNPAHYEEDREPLSTRPAGEPDKPDEYGYQEGGTVIDDVDDDEDETWQEPPPERDLIDEPEEREPPEERDPLDEIEPLEPPEDREPGEPPEGAAPTEEAGGAADEAMAGGPEGDTLGGGGPGGGPTGYRQARGAGDEGEEQAAAPPETGFDPSQPRMVSTPLKDVLDYTRKTLGVRDEKAAPAEAPAGERERAAGEVAARIPVPVGAPEGRSGVAGGAPGEEGAPPAPADLAARPEAEPRVPVLPPAAAGRAPPSGTQSGPGNLQAIRDYVSGKRAMTPDEMTELLDRTNQTNPNLGQDGAIRQAFRNLIDKGDIDGASRFVQALRPSYDSVRALMIAATAQGDFATAMQLAERMNNLIPNGDKATFTNTPDGRILATIRPEDGGAPTQFALTPEQFARYANSPLSLFDHTAEQGLDRNFSMLTGEPGRQGTGQLASAERIDPVTGRPVATDAPPAGRVAPPPASLSPTGYIPIEQRRALGERGADILREHGPTTLRPPAAAPPAAAPPPARAAPPAAAPPPVAPPAAAPPPVTGYNPQPPGFTRPEPPQPLRMPARAPQQLPPRPQPPAPRYQSEEWREYEIKRRAWEAFPNSAHRAQRGRYEQLLDLQDRRYEQSRQTAYQRQVEAYNRQARGGGALTAAERLTIDQQKGRDANYREELRQYHLNHRAGMVSESNQFRALLASDTAMFRALLSRQSASERNYTQELVQRMRIHAAAVARGATTEDFVYTQRDKDVLLNAAKTAIDYNLVTVRGRGAPAPAAPAAAPAVPTAPAAPAARTPAAAPPAMPAGVDLDKYTHPTNPPRQLTAEEQKNWEWIHSERTDNRRWRLVPKEPAAAPAAPARPAPPPAPAPTDVPDADILKGTVEPILRFPAGSVLDRWQRGTPGDPLAGQITGPVIPLPQDSVLDRLYGRPRNPPGP